MSAPLVQPTVHPQYPPTNPPDTPLLVAVPDAARLLGIGATLAWDLVRSGEIPSRKLGRRVLIPRAALESLARHDAPDDEQRVGTHADSAHLSTPELYQGGAQFRHSAPGPTGHR